MKNEKIIKYIISAILVVVLFSWFIKCDMPKELLYSDLTEYEDEYKSQTPTLNLPKGHYDVILNYTSFQDAELVVYKDDHSPMFLSLPVTNGAESSFDFSVDLERGFDYFRLSADRNTENNISFNSFLLKSSRPLYYDKIIILAMAIIILSLWFLVAFIYDRRKNSMYKRICDFLNIDSLSILLLLLALLISSIPCFYDYITKTTGQDLNAHISRIEGIKSGIISGQFPVQLYPESYWGFGLLGTIYPSLFLYIPALLRLLFRVSVVFSWNFFSLLINFITLITMYYSINIVTKKNRLVSTIATIIYVLAPYRLNNMYVRSAVGETLAMAFMPLIIAGLYIIFCDETEENNNHKNYFPLVIGLTCTLQSHLISIIYAVVICIVFGLVFIKKLLKADTLKVLIKAALLTFMLCASFLISYIGYIKSENLNLDGLNRNMAKTAIGLNDLFSIIPKTVEGSDSLATFHSLGIIGALIFILTIFVYVNEVINKRLRKDNSVIFSVTSLMLAVIFTFLSTRFTPWGTLHKISTIDSVISKFQFPWRFLSLATLLSVFALAIIASKAYPVSKITAKGLILTSAAIFTIALISIIPLFVALSHTSTRITKVSGAVTEGRMDEYLPYTSERDQDWAYRTYAILSDYDAIYAANYDKVYSTISFEYSADKDGLYIDMPLTYYSNYKAYEFDSNGNRIDLKTDIGEHETVRVYINKHEDVRPVLVYFGMPLHAYIGLFISLCGLIIFIICLVSFCKKLPKSNS